jgi:hypothetical protein
MKCVHATDALPSHQGPQRSRNCFYFRKFGWKEILQEPG